MLSGLTEAPAAGGQVPVRLPRPNGGKAAYEEGEAPIRAAPHKLARRKAATQPALLSHTKQEKSVFVTQLSLSTMKWAEIFKHSKKKKTKICQNASKETPLKYPATAN